MSDSEKSISSSPKMSTKSVDKPAHAPRNYPQDSFVSDGKSKTSGKVVPIGTFDLPNAASQIGESLRISFITSGYYFWSEEYE